ncbi:MAG: PrgI family protein [Parcubacteria group bacterium]|jgi:hypothetical protein
MLFNVPQHIDVEDKIAGPFTAKQLLWMFGMGAVLLISWGLLDRVTFFISAVPVALIFCALAFYRPHGQPLVKFILWGVTFAFKPKVYIWKRDYIKKNKSKKKAVFQENVMEEKKEEKREMLADSLKDLARTLDSEGKERNEKMMEIIRRNREKKQK